MSPAHRPLSSWIAHLEPDSRRLGPVNDGDHRSDARQMSYFSEGWSRVAVSLGTTAQGLGLTRSDGTTVLELDDYGAPIMVSRNAVEIVEEVEQRWPTVDGRTVERVRMLASESLPLRYWLLQRLDAEGDPPAETFAILPWELLDRVVDAVVVGLEQGRKGGTLVEIRHWLTPAVRGVTGPLEQLDHGLRANDPHAARLGASALLTGLRSVSLDRIPQHSRTGLSRLVTLLGDFDPLYIHASRVATGLLTGQAAPPRIQTRLHSHLEPAAGTENTREHIETLGGDHQRLRIVETRASRLRLTARIAALETTDSPLAERVGVFLPIQLVSPAGPTERVWIALSREQDYLIGTVIVALPQGRSELDGDGPPVGADELSLVDREELLESMRASTATTAQRWLDLAQELPTDHPVHLAVNVFEDSL